MGGSVADISRPAKGRFRKNSKAPQSAANLRAKLGGRREEKMRNLKIMPGSDEIDVRDYITNRIASYNFFPAKNDSPLPRAPRMNNLSKVKPEIERIANGEPVVNHVSISAWE